MIKSNILVTPVSLVESSLNRMDVGGFNPKNRAGYKLALAYISTSVVCVMFFLQILFYFTNKYEDYRLFIIDIVFITGIWQLIIKHYTLLLKHRPIVKLIDTVKETFWSLNNLEESKRKEIQSVYNMTKLSVNCYFTCITVALFGHCTVTYWRGLGSLVLNIWMPESLAGWNQTFTGHLVICIVEAVITAYSSITVLIGIYSIYIILIAAALGQFKILKLHLLTVSGGYTIEENLDLLVKCIKHHNILLEYLEGIEKIFSIELVHIAGTIIIVSVLTMYSVIVEEDISQIAVYLFMFIASNAQLFIYCFLGQLVQNETEAVAEAAYQCKWEDIPDKRFRNSLILVILRSQRKFSFTMGGLFTLSLETFTSVARTMLSLLTFLTNMSGTKE